MTDHPEQNVNVKKAGGWTALLGFLLVLAGLAAIGSPFVAGAATTIVVGCLILISGIVELFAAFHQKGWKAGLPAFLGGMLAVIGGGLILAKPLLGMAILMLVITVYLVLDGLGRIALALNMKPARGWGWMLVGGVMTLVLGILLYAEWPLSGAWAIGTLLGIRILFAGWSLIILGSVVRSLPERA